MARLATTSGCVSATTNSSGRRAGRPVVEHLLGQLRSRLRAAIPEDKPVPGGLACSPAAGCAACGGHCDRLVAAGATAWVGVSLGLIERTAALAVVEYTSLYTNETSALCAGPSLPAIELSALGEQVGTNLDA